MEFDDHLIMTRRQTILLVSLAFTGTGCLKKLRLGGLPEKNQDRYDQAIANLKAAREPYARWCALGSAAKEALNYGQDAEAKAYAEELEKVIPDYPKDWNYGNAIQDSNIVLGVLALKAGDKEAAKSRLLASARSKGSPQMSSFGPNMTLAKALIESGEKAVVLEYFDLCGQFWRMHRGRLDEWREAVKAGRTPDFGANLIY